SINMIELANNLSKARTLKYQPALHPTQVILDIVLGGCGHVALVQNANVIFCKHCRLLFACLLASQRSPSLFHRNHNSSVLLLLDVKRGTNIANDRMACMNYKRSIGLVGHLEKSLPLQRYLAGRS